jgi:peroxiredoxin
LTPNALLADDQSPHNASVLRCILTGAAIVSFAAACQNSPSALDGGDGGDDSGIDAGDAGFDAGNDGGLLVEYTAVDLDGGQPVSLASLRGTPVLLQTWTTGCASCSNDLTWVEAFFLAHRHENLDVVAVDLDAPQDAAAASAMARSLGLTMPVWSDPANAFAAAFGISSTPATVLVDAQGRLAGVFGGDVSPDDPDLLALLQEQGVFLQSGTPCGAADTGGTSCVLVIQGRVTDDTGAPLVGASLTYCGLTTCYYGALDSTGAFRVELGVVVDPTQYALIVHGGLTAAGIYQQLASIVSPVVTLNAPIVTPLFPAQGVPLPLQPASDVDVASAGVALQIAAGTHLTIPIEDIGGDAGPQFVAVAVDPSSAPAFAPSSVGLLALYALGPFGATSSAPMSLVVWNTTGLPAGTAVEFLVLDDDLNTAPFAAGTMKVAAEGMVSPDGGLVISAPDAGIDALTWLGIRAAG